MLKWAFFHCFLGLILCYFASQLIFWKSNDKIPIIKWWTPFIPGDDRIISCHSLKCLVTNNRSFKNNLSVLNAIAFYGSHFKSYDIPLPRSSSHLWALYHGESPKNFPALLYLETQRLFNVTATFSRYSDYPLTLQYLNNSIDSLTDKAYYVNVIEKNKLLKDLAPVLYIQSNCDTFNDRDVLVQELMKFVKVDSYGSCLNNKLLPERLQKLDPLDIYNEDFLQFIAQYKFIVSIENALCEDYISEKLWRSLTVGAIPIYLGSPNVEDWLPNEQSAILLKDFKDIQHLSDYIKLVNENASLYTSYMDHKTFQRISNERLKNAFENDKGLEHDILNFECFLCRKLHDGGLFALKRLPKENVYKCEEPSKGSLFFFSE